MSCHTYIWEGNNFLGISSVLSVPHIAQILCWCLVMASSDEVSSYCQLELNHIDTATYFFYNTFLTVAKCLSCDLPIGQLLSLLIISFNLKERHPAQL